MTRGGAYNECVTDLPEQLHARFQDAYNRHDPESIAELYELCAVLVTRGGPVRGRDAIREAYRTYFATRPAIEVKTLGVNRAGDLAMLHGKWSLRETGPDGGLVCRDGRNTETERLQADGRWLFAIDDSFVPQD